MTENTITKKTALEICQHEAVIRQAYKDSVGVWTWSIGLTNATGHDVERYIDNPQPMQHCLDIFIWALEKYAARVRKAFTVQLTEAEFTGALSFDWNTGHIHDADWVEEFNAGDRAAAKLSIMNWRSPEEIIPRREAERDLIFDDVWSNDGSTGEYTRLEADHTPDWGSRVEVDISDELEAILAGGVQTDTPPPKPIEENEDVDLNMIISLIGAGSGIIKQIVGRDGINAQGKDDLIKGLMDIAIAADAGKEMRAKFEEMDIEDVEDFLTE